MTLKRLPAPLIRFGPAALIMVAIFAFSSTPSSNLPNFGGWDWVAKKGAHALGYAMLGAAYTHALAPGRPLTLRNGLIAIALAALYATSDEWHQSFTAGRHPAWTDVAIDTVGATVGVVAMRWLRP